MNRRFERLVVGLAFGCAAGGVLVGASANPPATPLGAALLPDAALAEFHTAVEPILKQHCYECHGDGAKKAGVAFDELTTKEQILQAPEFWLKVLRNTRSRLMPPEGPAPSTAEQHTLEQWITRGAFGLDARQPDPGRVTVRRLNRTEYRNTLRDLIGVDLDVDTMLPPDDVGYGFDNIGDVLSISPMRMEKFIEAAMAAVEKGVPMDTVAISTQGTLSKDFLSADGTQNGERMSFYQARKVSHRYHARAAGDYRIVLTAKVDGEANPDPQRVRVTWRSDGTEIFRQEYKWYDAEYYEHETIVHWDEGEHELSFETQPLLDLQPLRTKMEFRMLFIRVDGPLDRKLWQHPPGYGRIYSRPAPPEDPAERRAYAREVLAAFVPKAFRRPVNADTIDRLVDLAERTYSIPGNPFEKGIAQAIVAVLASPRFLFHLERTEPPAAGQPYAAVDEYTLAARLAYALWCSMPDEGLTRLAARGELRQNFHAEVRRMLADPKARAFAENFSGQWLQSRGVIDVPINSAEVMAREAVRPAANVPSRGAEAAAPSNDASTAVGVAGNLSGLPPLSSPASPPPLPSSRAPAATAGPSALVAPAADGAVPRLAAAAESAGRATAPTANGAAATIGAPRGEVVIPGPAAPPPAGNAFGRGGRGRGRGPTIVPGTVLTPEIRQAMKQETEAYFAHIVGEDRSVLELLQSDYTFVNEPLAAVYGIPNISGTEMRRVTLPAGDVRGGVLTMGSVLTVTSNPTRTSPVKRGKWILENILGAPPAPPPPNIPALEDAREKASDREPTQRELLAAHRAEPACASCHSRMDPLGLAMENFNAFGRGRAQEYGLAIDPAGELATGEKFADVSELKQSLVTHHRIEFYRTLTEKLLTYTLGRGLEYYDVPTVDRIVERLDREEGRFSALLLGVLESAPFQQSRPAANLPHAAAEPRSVTSLNP